MIIFIYITAQLQRVTKMAARWIERARSRRQLAAMSTRSLRDMGLSRAAVAGEVHKPFWRG